MTSTYQGSCRKDGCDFKTNVGSELAAHLKTRHKSGLVIRVPKLPKLKRPGYAPRQTKPFVAEGLVVGATVTWSEHVPTGEMRRVGDYGDRREVPVTERVERSGQVWSMGGPNRSAWVIPHELREGETAVLVREVSYALPGRPKFEHAQTWAPALRRTAA